MNPAVAIDVARAIELSSFLWGGSYNPIIPVFGRTPGTWEARRSKTSLKPTDIISGYLEGFDPDIVVPVGSCSRGEFQVGNRDLVQESELVGDLKTAATMQYGIGLIELLRDFLDKEMKFVRNDDLHFSLPEYPRAYRLFLTSVFGGLIGEAREIIDEHFAKWPGVTRVNVDINNFFDMWRHNRLFPRHLSMHTLDHIPHRDKILFVCDARKTLDIIDYWNLRAAGHHVMPLPIQVASNDEARKMARKFIEENYHPHRRNPDFFNNVTVQRSRSLPESVVGDFCKSLNIEQPKEAGRFKYTLRWWYPRMWDGWARENAFGESIEFPYSHEEERRLLEDETRLEMNSIESKVDQFEEYSGKPRIANEFSFRFYGYKELMAEVIPQGGRTLASAIGTIGYPSWRFAQSGPVFLANSRKELIFLDLPRAEAVMLGWFKERGWKVSLSGPGRIAKSLIKQLGGAYGTTWLAHRGVIRLLGDLEKEAGLPRQAIIARLKKVIEEDGLHFEGERFLERLIELNALRLGAKIQCPVCTRLNWFELNALTYQLACRFCLSEFVIPQGSPKQIQWSYRAHGPFASSIAQGSFTVLLTFKFFGSDHEPGLTPIFSYVAEKNGKTLEADLTCLYRRSTWRVSPSTVLHAECKSFNRFEKRDVDRMAELSRSFPGSALVFSTLNESLNTQESKAICRLVLSERKKRFRGEQYSPVIVLTGIELFSLRGLSDCWEGRGGLYETFHRQSFHMTDLQELADATQRLYLDIESWSDWSGREREKRIAKRKQSK